MSAASEFVSQLLLARDRAHLAHWKVTGTGSFAAHMALGEFYEKLIDLTDKFVEQYQGSYDELLDIDLSTGGQTEIKKFLESQVAWIDAHRSRVCNQHDTSLQNTIDEILRLYETTLYKLRFLS